jgi:transaldolase
MKTLKKRGVSITATGIYSKIQGFAAIAVGADFIAPYCNRMENQDIDPLDTIASFAKVILANKSATRIVAASFKNIAQLNAAFVAGAHTVTIQPTLFHEVFCMAAIRKAVDDFAADWESVFGSQGILELAALDK